MHSNILINERCMHHYQTNKRNWKVVRFENRLSTWNGPSYSSDIIDINAFQVYCIIPVFSYKAWFFEVLKIPFSYINYIYVPKRKLS